MLDRSAFGDQRTAVLPTPGQMIQHLDRFVLGQERAKRDLATSFYTHYAGVRYGELPGSEHRDFERQHILLLGPTGSGKTLLVRTLADFLGVPLSVASATSFAETGYVGDKVESLVATLLALTDWDPTRAQRGVVFLDEVDKIKRAQAGPRDVSGEGVQNALLTLLDGREMTVRAHDRSAVIDVSKILFVCTGAFVGLADIVRHRTAAGAGFGFSVPRGEVAGPLTDDQALARVATIDLQDFGLIPEFIGRFSTITALSSLSRKDLIDIMTATQSSVIPKQQAFFRLHGVSLEFEPGALEAIADLAVALHTGARGLRRIVLKVLDPVDWRLPDLAAQGVTRVVITRACVENGAEPVLDRTPVPGAPKPRIDEVRESALHPPIAIPAVPRGQRASVLDALSDKELRVRLKTARSQLALGAASIAAQSWWREFEERHDANIAQVAWLAEELASRRVTLGQFYDAWVKAGSLNLEAVIAYLDYLRLRHTDGPRTGPTGGDADGPSPGPRIEPVRT